ncbi:MAG: bifunctional 4-hydroxy-2-oxoglutarate aldolase/2-dehydro-3-deoxy-phosphogluconate aldolase [Lentisphaeria bacterium]|jgi:2-dehydro-3-deoxyphosphogluconate aldolase/(4S)-4-hydroxy-2-oxoglutarate aldolase|nr:bifunctional 4-hydroxy-2-oxoglutarate aldolase/2-dehydro-3-deoxy-phosphogluconate aldolase [Lentisphaeria bacterium]MBQ8755225.1 bifunctional 4-hydroxy-2-oxoglutarate aldolase/2-dehydro-3-deoxy-phosphogluconate aldolase [Lentisphaeria bacterium]
MFTANTANVVEKLNEIKIVPVLVLNDLDSGLKMCEILVECGLPAAEITFRTQAAESIIKAASDRFPELYLGAGTILNTADLDRAFNAGAKFAVAPGFNPTVVKAAVEKGYAFAPGICTPSELEQAHELGCKFLKFFPAEAAGGVPMLKSLIAPYKHLGVRFMPTGGVSTANVTDYISIKEVVAVGGTWLGKADDIAAGNWDKIREVVKAAVALKEGK